MQKSKRSDPSFIDLSIRIEQAVKRLSSRPPLDERRLKITECLKGIDVAEIAALVTSKLLPNDFRISGIHSTNDADDEEFSLWILCVGLMRRPTPAIAFDEVFGQDLGRTLHRTIGKLTSSWRNLHTAGSDIVDEENSADDDEDDDSAHDFESPFATAVAAAVEKANTVMLRLKDKFIASAPEKYSKPNQDSALAPGARVLIINILSRPELNGKPAVVIAKAKLTQEEERWKIRCDHSGEEFALKKSCLVVTKAASAEVESTKTSVARQGFGHACCEVLAIVDGALGSFPAYPRASSALRRLLRKAYAIRGATRALSYLFTEPPQQIPTPSIQLVQLDAAFVSYYSKRRDASRRQPDAAWLRGIAQV